MKHKFILSVFVCVSMLFSCSIDRADKLVSTTIETEIVLPSEQYPAGGFNVYFYTNNVLSNTIFLSNGINGKDGVNGIDGINGKDGVSATVETELVLPNADNPWGGYVITLGVGTNTRTIFISNGANGTNGINGIDGTSVKLTSENVEGGTIIYIVSADGESSFFVANGANGTNGINGLPGMDGKDGKDGLNGTNATITSESVEGGVMLYITVDGVTKTEFISNGIDGTDGLNGTNGKDGLPGINGIDGINGTNASIRTEKVNISAEHPYGGYNLYITVDGQTTVTFVSNGKDGTNGLNGANGQNGYSSSIKVEKYTGAYCEFGGLVIITSSTDPSVETEHTYICNCECEVKENCSNDEDKKIEICHKESKGNGKSSYHTIWVPIPALQAHINHGDKIGNCDDCAKW